MSGRGKFAIELPEEPPSPEMVETKSRRRGPMAAAIRENAMSLQERKEVERAAREENDELARKYADAERSGRLVVEIPIDAIDTTKLERDRKWLDDDALRELMGSIRAVGLANPIRVEREGDRFQLVQGLRRLAAYELLHAEASTESDKQRWATIPAAFFDPADGLLSSYRRMVDENLVRQDVSFAELALLAMSFARDPETEARDVDGAVRLLFESAGYQKRSYIRAFAQLLEQIGDQLSWPERIGRNLGLDVKKKLDAKPDALAGLRADLALAEDQDAELRALEAFARAPEAQAPNRSAPRAKAAPKVVLEVRRPSSVERCAVSANKLELSSSLDLSQLDETRLRRAIDAFYSSLGI